jgi:hypothetical protein
MNEKNKLYKSNRKKNKLLYAVCELVKEKCAELNSFIGENSSEPLKLNKSESKS